LRRHCSKSKLIVVLTDRDAANVVSGDSIKDAPAPEKPDQEMKGLEPERTPATKDEKPKDEAKKENAVATEAKPEDAKPAREIAKPEEPAKTQESEAAKEESKPAEGEPAEPTSATSNGHAATDLAPVSTNDNAVEPHARDSDKLPSTILEKGIIYFFFRSRVNVEDPQDVNDIARSFMVLRPIPLDARLGDGPIGDEHNCRLLALPKKVLPKSGKDRFVTFIEKSKTSFADLKNSFLKGSDYETKTQGTRHTPAVTPLAEGIYAFTSTGKDSHMAYILNIPSELGEVQKDFGLRERGSFVVSVKNPDKPPTSGAQQQNVPGGADYPKDIIDDFKGLRWAPLTPRLIDWDGATFLMIGEDFVKATESRPKDEREGKDDPEKEIEKLEGEDEIRVEHLKGEKLLAWGFENGTNDCGGDDAIFADLQVTTKDIPEIKTTW
jgi:hypothetical protein